MQNKFIQKSALLLISIFLMSHLAIAPAIPKLYDIYHNANQNIGLTSVESLVTIPAMMITLFLLLSNFVVSFIGKKYTIIVGLILISLSGIIAFFTTNFTIVLISRLLLGIGIGLYNSLSISIISDYYENDEKATMIGLRTAFLNIGKALTTLISGYAIIIGANYVYLVYLLALPVLILFTTQIDNKKETTNNIKSVVKFDKNVILLMIMTFFVGISYIGATIKIPTLLITHYKMSITTSNAILTILALSGIVSGIIFGQLIKTIKYKTMLIMISMMLIGNTIFLLTKETMFLYIAAIFIGISFVGIMSSVFYYISNNYDKKNINFITSMTLLAGNIGVIITPLILTKIPEKLNFELYKTPFLITTTFMLINFGIYFILNKKKS